MFTIRPARVQDIGAMHRVRLSVRENRLVSVVLTEEDYGRELTAGGGWVAEENGRVLGFAIANAENGNVWALFVDPYHEGKGIGRQLHDAMIGWMSSQAVETWWLTTEPATRAERFYDRAGWSRRSLTSTGEVRFERSFRRLPGAV